MSTYIVIAESTKTHKHFPIKDEFDKFVYKFHSKKEAVDSAKDLIDNKLAENYEIYKLVK